jgi:hypothetical protein
VKIPTAGTRSAGGRRPLEAEHGILRRIWDHLAANNRFYKSIMRSVEAAAHVDDAVMVEARDLLMIERPDHRLHQL